MRYILSFLLLISGLAAQAQDVRIAIDSLTRSLKSAVKKEKAGLYIALGNEYRIISGDTTLLYAEEALGHSLKHNDRRNEAESYILKGAVMRDRGNYEQALTFQLKALDIIEQLQDNDGLASVYNSIGILYKKMRRWDEALEYYLKANQLAKKTSETTRLSLIYNNIGTIYLEKQEWDKVEKYYDSALRYAELSKDRRALATVLSNKADLYRAQLKYDEAIVTLKRCLKYDKLNNDKYGMYMSYFQLARVYSELKDYAKWRTYADSAEKITIQEQLLRERIDLLSWSATVAEWQGDIKSAYDFYRQARTINDSLLTENTAKHVSELQTQYETEKKEQQIALQQSELKNKNYIIGGISGVLLLGGLLSYSYYRRYRLMQQAKLQQAVMQQQELATQAVLEAEERERQRIAGDLHDGVGQLMSAARMNLSVIANDLAFETEDKKLKFEKALSLVDDSCKEVRSVSHNIMPNALLKSGLVSAVREFIQKIDERALEVSLYTDGINERMPSNVETVLYRVIQECVNNVIKHSKANKLDITLIKDEEGISATIEDNGKGFNPGDESGGIGMKNMQTRIHYLKGSIEWDSAPGKGTVVTIQVPHT
ncbi:MAG TPA: sensor histidine kinase [Flavipsychrobacter sp.]